MEIKDRFIDPFTDFGFKKLFEEEMKTYEANLKEKRDWQNALAYAMAEAESKGMEQGMEQGIEKGMEKERLVIAKNMKDEGIAEKVISKLTGLSIEEINSL